MELPPPKLLIASLLTAFCGLFESGYYAGVINVPQQLFLKIINETNIHRYGHPLSDSTLNIVWGFILSTQLVGG